MTVTPPGLVLPGPSNLSPARLPALDAVRAVAAFAVLIYHVGFDTGLTLTGIWPGLVARFDVGVAIFFVLSGLLLLRPFLHAVAVGGPRPGIGRYLWRRALRILPAYWVTVIVCLTVLPQNGNVSGDVWLRYLTLTQIYGVGDLRPGLGQTWSLATEVSFYLVLPLVSLGLVGRRWRPGRTAAALALLGVGSTAGWLIAASNGLVSPWPGNLWLPTYGLWFGAGMCLAVALVSVETAGGAPLTGFPRLVRPLANAPLATWTIAVAVLAIASTPLTGPRGLGAATMGNFSVKIVLYTIVAVLGLIPIMFGPDNRVRAAFGSGTARWFGGISYGLFLWHPFILDWIYRPGGRPILTGDPVSTLTVTIVGSVLLATLSYYLVERPIQRLGARWPRRRTGTVIDNQLAVSAANANS